MALSYGPGNWQGLPEFGFTELLGGKTQSLVDASVSAANQGQDSRFTSPITSEPARYKSPVVAGPFSTSAFSANVNLSPNTSVPSAVAETTPQPTSRPSRDTNLGVGNSNSSGSVRTTVGGQTFNSQSDARRFLEEIDKAFNSNLDFLGKAESSLRQSLPSIEQDINTLSDSNARSLATERDIAAGGLDTQTEQTDTRRENAIIAARRLYNELVRGGQQRFGGATSAGEAFQAISGRELQRNRATIEQDYQQFQQKMGQARNNLQQQYATALQAIEARKSQMVNESRREFRQKLLEIDRLRSTSNQARADAKLGVLQNLRNQMFQINLAEAQSRQNVDKLRTISEQELGAAEQQFTSTLNSAGAAASNYNPTVANEFTLSAPTTEQNTLASAIGTINPRRKDEQLVGAVANPRSIRDLFNLA